MVKRGMWAVTTLLAAGAIYCWMPPLIWPRGIYFWGHYRLVDVFAGVPLAVSALESALLLSCPIRFRRPLAFRMIPVTVLILVVVGCADAVYTVGVCKAYTGQHSDFWFHQETPSGTLPDEELGFVRRPGLTWEGSPFPGGASVLYRTDENGFRNPPNQARADVVFIGDSFTEAGTVTEGETFVRLAEHLTGLTVVNLGRAMYGPQQELIVLEKFGFEYQPRAVVWQIFEGNDLSDARRFKQWAENPTACDPFLLRYAKRSPLVWLLTLTAPSQSYRWEPLDLPDGHRGRVALDYCYDPTMPRTEAVGLEETQRVIKEGQARCKEKGIELLIVFVPVKVRVLEGSVRFESDAVREYYLPGGRSRAVTDFGNVLGDYCRSIGCAYLDTTDGLQESAEKDCRAVFHIGADPHLDVNGHRVVAELVAGWLRSRGLVRNNQGGAAR